MPRVQLLSRKKSTKEILCSWDGANSPERSHIHPGGSLDALSRLIQPRFSQPTTSHLLQALLFQQEGRTHQPGDHQQGWEPLISYKTLMCIIRTKKAADPTLNIYSADTPGRSKRRDPTPCSRPQKCRSSSVKWEKSHRFRVFW